MLDAFHFLVRTQTPYETFIFNKGIVDLHDGTHHRYIVMIMFLIFFGPSFGMDLACVVISIWAPCWHNFGIQFNVFFEIDF